MCGLAGYSGNKPVDVAAIKILLLDNEVRGSQSVGVYGRQLFRTTDSPRDAIKDEAFNNAIINSQQVIAHNRFATQGAVTKENAHPFKFGEGKDSLYGTHNGFILDELFEPLVKKFNVNPVPEVDSQVIYHILYNSGMNFDILSEIEAVAALAFVYKNKLHLYRRPSRPLFIGEVEGGIYYSSRSEGLFMIGCKYVQLVPPHMMNIFENGLLIEAVPVKKSVLHYLPEDTGPYGWKWKVNEADKLKFPDVWRTEEKKSQTYRSSTEKEKSYLDSIRAGGSGSEDGSQNRQGGGTTKEEFEELFSYLELDLLENSTNATFKHTPKFKDLYESSDLNGTHLVLSVRDDVHEAPVPNWVVGIKGYPASYKVTSYRGFVVMKLPYNMIVDEKTTAPKEVELIVTDPLNYKVYYTKKLIIPAMRVMEGTLLIPFRATEKKAGQGSLRAVENNLFSRAILHRTVRKTRGINFTSSSETSGNEKTGGQCEILGVQSSDTESAKEIASQRIREAVRPALLLLAAKSETSAASEGVVQVGNELSSENSSKTNTKNTEVEARTGAQDKQVLAEVKDPSYGDYTDSDFAISEEAYRHSLMSDLEHSENPDFWLKMQEQALKDERAKNKRMAAKEDVKKTSITTDVDNVFEAKIVPMYTPKSNTFKFFPFEKEEHLILHQKAHCADILDKIMEAIKEIEPTILNDSPDQPKEQIKRALLQAYGSLLLLQNDAKADLDQYTQITKEQDFLPF